MKNLLCCIILIFLATCLSAQSFSKGIHYQTIVRDTKGVVKNKEIKVTIDILSGSNVFREVHQVKTNDFGLINLLIGSVEKAAFEDIPWNYGEISMHVSMDFGNGNIDFGSRPLVAVPFALKVPGLTTKDINNINETDASNGDILVYDDGEWVLDQLPEGDNWGNQSVKQDGSLEGNGTNQNPLRIAQQNAANGQILKWNGQKWKPQKDEDEQNLSLTGTVLSISNGNNVDLNPILPEGDNWGNQSVKQDGSLEGNGTNQNPLKIAQQNAVSGQILKWNGQKWKPQKDEDEQNLSLTGTVLSISNGNNVDLNPILPEGDNWGNQSVSHSDRLTGDGTNNNPLDIAQQNANEGDMLSWNGSQWQPSDPGVQEIVAGTGLSGGGSQTTTTINAKNADPLWNANKLDGYNLSITNPLLGQAIVYDAGMDQWINAFQNDGDFLLNLDVPGWGSGLGALYPTNFFFGTDVNDTEVSGRVIIGDINGEQLAFDANDILAKGTPIRKADLNLQRTGGSVFIGSDSPNDGLRLIVEGGTDVGSGFLNSGFLAIGDPNNQHIAFDPNEILCKGSGNTPGILYMQDDGGKLVVGTRTSNVTHVFQVGGPARSTQSTWATSSDRRVKEHVLDLQNSLGKILALRPVEFDWKKNYEGNHGHKSGFIAQEVETVIPEMVSKVQETYEGKKLNDFRVLSLDALFPRLVGAIQEQNKTIEQQQKIIQQLLQRVEALEQQNSNAK